MDLKKTGGQAFPTSDQSAAHTFATAAIEGIEDTAERDRVYTAARAQAQQGMTLRDYFASKAMHGIVNNGAANSDAEAAKWAYEIADAMLSERAK